MQISLKALFLRQGSITKNFRIMKPVTFLFNREFYLQPIFEEENKKIWELSRKHSNEYSDFECVMLRKLGELFFKGNATFWLDGELRCFKDEKQCEEQSIWLTANGIPVFQDYETNQMWRIMVSD
jgi:hypothetical protein